MGLGLRALDARPTVHDVADQVGDVYFIVIIQIHCFARLRGAFSSVTRDNGPIMSNEVLFTSEKSENTDDAKI